MSILKAEETQMTEEWLESILQSYCKYMQTGSLAWEESENGTEGSPQEDPGSRGGSAERSPLEEPDIEVHDFHIQPGCEEGEGMLSDLLAIDVTFKVGRDGEEGETQSLSLMAKLLPHEPFSRFFVTEAKFDLREINFYTKVVHDLQAFEKKCRRSGSEVVIAVPQCYHAKYHEGCDSILVLENLKSQGYHTTDFYTGLSKQQTEVALAELARIHALSFVMKVKEEVNLIEKYPFLFQTQHATNSYQNLIERGFPQLAKFLQSSPDHGEILIKLQNMKPYTKDLISDLLSPQEPLSLITHTDFWCNNLMFRKETGDLASVQCKILDWQMITYSRPTNDIALLLLTSIPTELRRSGKDHFLQLYWSTFTSCTAQFDVNVETDYNYTMENLSTDYKSSQLLALLLCIGSVDIAIGNAATEQRLLELLEDLSEEGII